MNITITLIIQGLAFFTVAWLVMKFGWPNIIAAIEERQQKIADGLAAADKARKELADADAKVVEEIKKARSEAAQINERAHQQYQQIVDKAKQDAILEAQKQRQIAQAELDNLSHKAKETLRQQVAALAVKGAEKILQREIDATRHRDLIEQLAKEI